jgi:hypothetical protein
MTRAKLSGRIRRAPAAAPALTASFTATASNTTIDAPSAIGQTFLIGINNAGQIIGLANSPSGGGFLYGAVAAARLFQQISTS